MGWKQIQDANWRVPYTGGWCLNYVQRAFGTPWAGATATDSWNRAQKKHYDLPPAGVTVPVYFSGISGYDGDPGHISIILDDGYVASSTLPGDHASGYLHKNLDDLINTYRKYHRNFTYLGWSEDLGGVDLVQYVPDETPLGSHQRKVGASGVYYRTAPNTSADGVNKDDPIFDAGTILDFKGFVHGESVDGNDVWFVGAYSNGYAWSGGFEDSGTHDLPDLTPTAQQLVAPTDNQVALPYAFTKDLDCVTEVVPAANGNFKIGNFPESPEKIVVHDFGTRGIDTYQSTKHQFQKEGTEVSAHFVVSGDNIAQAVKLGDRAYHAGVNGNNYIGIETDPAQDERTIASARKLIAELETRYNKRFELIKHSSLMATNCGDDVDLSRYDIHTQPEQQIEAPNKKEEPMTTQPTKDEIVAKQPTVTAPATTDIQNILNDAMASSAAQELTAGISRTQKLIGYIIGDVLLVLAITMGSIFALAEINDVNKLNAATTICVALGGGLLTFIGVYRPKKD